MQIIPVIDLKDGRVVSAQQGQRESYQAIKSKLCSSGSIEEVINGFFSIYPFKKIYIADLNAITETGNNDHLIKKVISENKAIEFWVDNGMKIQNLSTLCESNYKLIIGSESQNLTKYNATKKYLKNTILSLDFFPNQGYTGPKELFENSTVWPQDIIIMSLERVGKNLGPDTKMLKQFKHKYPEKNFIAAGGIRNEIDLLTLKEMGINMALIASALHSGVIDLKVINKLNPVL